MSNFVAFRFTDNDFHDPLRQAIDYVVANREEELTLDQFRRFVLRGMYAFYTLRRINNWHTAEPNASLPEYFNKLLTVSEIKTLDELGDNFEGYVFDRNTMNVFYQGY